MNQDKDIEKQVSHSSYVLFSNELYSLHIFKGKNLGLENKDKDPWKEGHSIVHISKDIDNLTWVYSSGIFAKQTKRISYIFRRIVGLSIKDDVLWIAYYQSNHFHTDAHDLRPDQRTIGQYLSSDMDSGAFYLSAYSLSSPSHLGTHLFNEPPNSQKFNTYLLTSEKVKKIIVKDHFGNGPLQLSKDKVQCFGEDFEIKKNKLSRLKE